MIDKILNSYNTSSLVIAKGYDNAVIGIDVDSERIIYSIRKCLEILVALGLNEDESVDYLQNNTMNEYTGNNRPIWCDDIF